MVYNILSLCSLSRNVNERKWKREEKKLLYGCYIWQLFATKYSYCSRCKIEVVLRIFNLLFEHKKWSVAKRVDTMLGIYYHTYCSYYNIFIERSIQFNHFPIVIVQFLLCWQIFWKKMSDLDQSVSISSFSILKKKHNFQQYLLCVDMNCFPPFCTENPFEWTWTIDEHFNTIIECGDFFVSELRHFTQ